MLTRAEILKLSSVPILGSAYPPAPNHFIDREYMVISYETDIEAIKAVLPEPLVPESNIVNFEVMKMPDSSGFGDYTESGLVIPCLLNGEKVSFPLMMFLDDDPPISGGREIWGFPKKYGKPKLEVVHDTFTGTLHYDERLVALGTMAYKYQDIAQDPDVIAKRLGGKQVMLKFIPCVTGAVAVAQLISVNMINVKVKGAWSGPARLHLVPHVHAPLADFPVRKIVGGYHYIADMTLPYGKIEIDYLKG